jgi:hypothetical protein
MANMGLFEIHPPLFIKERGIKGERFLPLYLKLRALSLIATIKAN